MLYKFEALVGGIFLVFNAFKLTRDLSVLPVPGPIPETRSRRCGRVSAARKGFCALPASPGLLPALF